MVGLERYKSLKQLPPFRTLAEVTEMTLSKVLDRPAS
jgi:hypothetical protein